jgi:XTP/dITP diphosphohydrolase
MPQNNLLFASSNPEKIFEVSQVLSEYGIPITPLRMELNEIRSEDQILVAIQKAKTAFEHSKMPSLAEDTGVYFKAYDNFPGALPSFVFRSIGYDGIMRLLHEKSRQAYFKTILCYFDGETCLTFEGICKGEITTEPDEKRYQNMKLPYEAIFIPQGKKQRFCRMSKEEKAEISHRAKAVRKFAQWYLDRK